MKVMTFALLSGLFGVVLRHGAVGGGVVRKKERQSEEQFSPSQHSESVLCNIPQPVTRIPETLAKKKQQAV
jgi:pantothenate kinase